MRALQVKSNKSQTLYDTDNLVVCLAANSRGTGFLSAHADGNVVRFYISSEHREREPNGCVLTHSVPPYALAWTQGQIFAAGCDKRVVVYSAQGKVLKQFDYGKESDGEREFTVATSSPSGQAS